jgi:hypothetical protein
MHTKYCTDFLYNAPLLSNQATKYYETFFRLLDEGHTAIYN